MLSRYGCHDMIHDTIRYITTKQVACENSRLTERDVCVLSRKIPYWWLQPQPQISQIITLPHDHDAYIRATLNMAATVGAEIERSVEICILCGSDQRDQADKRSILHDTYRTPKEIVSTSGEIVWFSSDACVPWRRQTVPAFCCCNCKRLLEKRQKPLILGEIWNFSY